MGNVLCKASLFLFLLFVSFYKQSLLWGRRLLSVTAREVPREQAAAKSAVGSHAASEELGLEGAFWPQGVPQATTASLTHQLGSSWTFDRNGKVTHRPSAAL